MGEINTKNYYLIPNDRVHLYKGVELSDSSILSPVYYDEFNAIISGRVYLLCDIDTQNNLDTEGIK